MMSMRTVELYWGHICVMHNFEKEHLARARDRLARQGIDLRVTCFGMGYGRHMASYLRDEDALLPDIVVSADLEVFENALIAAKLGPCYPCSSWMELKNTPIVRASRRGDGLLPFVAIPMTAYGSVSCEGASLIEAVDQCRVSFGGIDNSAAKTVVKAVWERYGEEAARHVLEECRVTDMPIEAFQAARMGAVDVSIAPSLYGLRADGVRRVHGTFAEGPLLLPTYFCARKSVDEETARAVRAEIMSLEAFDFYARNADLVACCADASVESSQEHAERVWAVDQAFALGLGPRFYDVYCDVLEGAENLS